MKGALLPDESVRIYVEINRRLKAPGEYWGTFLVKSKGDGYRYDKPIYVLMVVGDTVVTTKGPEIVTVNPNTGPARNQIDLYFDSFIDPACAGIPANYRIEPPIEIYRAEVNENVISLMTEAHEQNTLYTISIDSLEDVIGRKSYPLTASYQIPFCAAGPELTLIGSQRKYIWDVVVAGKRIYTDNNITLAQIPVELEGSALLRTNTEDGTNPELELTFPVHGEDSKIILAVDPEYSGEWSSRWIDRDFSKIEATLPVVGQPALSHFVLYQSKRTFQPGEVVQLFENGAPNRDRWMYFVLVQGSEPMLNLAGTVSYHTSGRLVPDVQLALSGGMNLFAETDARGLFTFWDLDSLCYRVRPSKTGDLGTRTILMYDAALAARIAREELPGANEFQRIAADVTGDGVVGTDDAQEIARFAVGLPPGMSQTGQWRFLPESREYPLLDATVTDADFTALVLGDVGGNWAPTASPVGSMRKVLSVEKMEKSVTIEAGELRLPVILDANDGIASFYFSIEYDPHDLEFQAVRLSRIGEQFEVMHNTTPGQVRFGGFHTSQVFESGEYLQAIFTISASGQIPDKVEITHSVNGRMSAPVTLVLTGRPSAPFLFQNYPNPFNPETRIAYQLVHIEPVLTTVQIFNVKGQLVRELVNQLQSAGMYLAVWDGNDMRQQSVASGVYFLLIESGAFHQTRKILKFD